MKILHKVHIFNYNPASCERFMQKAFALILFLLVSCGQNSTGNDTSATGTKSSGVNEAAWPTLKDIRQRYILTYDQPVEFSSLDEGKKGEEINVWGKYYCLLDNDIDIPGKYMLDDKAKSFTTHNFAEDLVIISNKDTIIKKTITKKDFSRNLSSDLANYGVISAPVFYGYDEKSDAFGFYFKISIPITNIAASKKLSIKRNGDLVITEK